MSSAESVATWIELVARTPALREQLAAETDHARFATACAELARNHGLTVEADAVRTLLQQRHLQWLQRHVL